MTERATTNVMTSSSKGLLIAALIAALAVGLAPHPARAAAPVPITEVRPAQLARGGTLIIVCKGIDPGKPVTVSLSGRPAGTAGSTSFDGPATAAPGEVWLRLDLPPGRFENLGLEVRQEARVWRLAPERGVALTVTPPPPSSEPGRRPQRPSLAPAMPPAGRPAPPPEARPEPRLPSGPPEKLLIRDAGPLTVEPGDVFVVECPGVVVGAKARVSFSGRLEGKTFARFSENGETARGDRVLIRVDKVRPMRLTELTLEVKQGSRTWTLPPGQTFTFEVSPPGLRSMARKAGEAFPALADHAGLVAGALILVLALLIHLLVAPVTGMLVVWERKIWGRMQSRLGPNRVGPHGWGQWLADAIKMITKEDIVPTAADSRLFRFAPYLMWMSVFASFVVLPLTGSAVVADMNVGLLYLVSFTSLTVIAVLLGGWTSNSKWSLLGGMRSAAQIVSYELPASLALLQIALLAGSLAPQAIVRAQGGMPQDWFVFSNPFAFVSFFIYFIAALAEANRTPFDLPEAESELVAGFTTEYSGFRYGVFSLAEWTNLYVLAALVSVAFLGGWNVPFCTPDEVVASGALTVVSAGIMIAKVVALVFVIIWIRATLPRLRMDQLMALCWKYLIPIAFATFLGTAAWLWVTHAAPALATAVRWGTFLLGGVALGAFFVWRVVASFRGSRLLEPPAPGAAP